MELQGDPLRLGCCNRCPASWNRDAVELQGEGGDLLIFGMTHPWTGRARSMLEPVRRSTDDAAPRSWAVTTGSAGTSHQGCWKRLAKKLQPLDGDGSAVARAADEDERGTAAGGAGATTESWLVSERRKREAWGSCREEEDERTGGEGRNRAVQTRA